MSDVSYDERISRFLVHSNEYNASRPTYVAYMPDSKGEKSVYRTDNLSHEELVSLGRDYVESESRRLKGYADQAARVIFGQELTIESETTPHPRHANIKGWKLNRAADRIKANKIAETATLMLY